MFGKMNVYAKECEFYTPSGHCLFLEKQEKVRQKTLGEEYKRLLALYRKQEGVWIAFQLWWCYLRLGTTNEAMEVPTGADRIKIDKPIMQGDCLDCLVRGATSQCRLPAQF
jgi:hypothetical protein